MRNPFPSYGPSHLIDTCVGAGGGAASPTSTMNRGIQTDVADGPLGGAGGLAAAGGASSSTFMQSTMVKNVYSTQQAGAPTAADSTLVDGSVLPFFFNIASACPVLAMAYASVRPFVCLPYPTAVSNQRKL